MTAPFPPGTRLLADPTLRLRNQGRVLLGGSPLRFFRLTEPGAAVVKRWLGGEAPGTRSGATALARRLVNAGMVHPDPPVDAPLQPVTVVIPVKDDQSGLNATMAGLSSLAITVVDDGSIRPMELVRDRDDDGAQDRDRDHVSDRGRDGDGGRDGDRDHVSDRGRDGDRNRSGGDDPRPLLLRRNHSGGPGVARQDGLATVESPLVAFVDAGVEVTGAQLERLCRWFADPEVVAVGPRVRSTPGPSRVDRYEATHSPLDLGPSPAPVGHGRMVSYLPTACLVARREAVEDAGGFDPALRFGEDVDLVWRLIERGQVRYDPSVTVSHPARSTIGGLARQRFGYGLAAAPLAERHGSELAPVRVSGWSLGCWGLALTGHPVLGLALATYTAAALSRKLSNSVPDHQVEAALLTARGHWFAGLSLADAGVRVWWPLLAGLSLAEAGVRMWGPPFARASPSPLGRPLRLLAALAWARKLRRLSGSPADRLGQLGLAVIDDVAYGTGVWTGAWRQRSARCLLPLLVNWPPKDDEVPTER